MSNELTDILNSKDVESVVLGPSAQAHEEGKFFYDNVTKTLSFHNDITDVTLNIGSEQYTRVFNNTGATISRGKACTQDGTNPTFGILQTKLALADTFKNAFVLGMAAHDIPDQTQGLLSPVGTVHGIDTSGLIANAPAFLSDTVPGGLTNTPPDIISRVGAPISIHATAGVFFAYVSSTITLPPLFGLLNTIPDIYNLTTVYQDLVNYQVEDAVTMPVDKLAGTITAPNSGRYRGSFTIVMTIPSLVSSRTITVQAWNVTQGVEAVSIPISVAKDITEVGRSMAVPFTAAADDVIIMRIKADTAINGVTIGSISFDIQSIHVV